ncbi:Iojap-related protein [gamma proteobacterium HdN1]|nr:Iojap-related protein [gamma proteobacterium HdN1]
MTLKDSAPLNTISAEDIKNAALTALDDMKAKDVVCLDIKPLTSMADYMIVASGTSTRHVKASADKVEEAARTLGVRPLGVEGAQAAEWVLVDLNDVIVHVMTPDTRRFYDLEKLWSITPEQSATASADSETNKTLKKATSSKNQKG